MPGVQVVTGASGGIGREIARGLAAQGARVVLACRDVAKAEAAVESVAGPAPEILLVDLSSQRAIRRAAAELVARHPSIDVLINNAAVAPARRLESEDGIELTWATNVLGYFLMTQALLPALERAGGRIINVASRMAYDLDLGDVEFTRRPYSAGTAYAQSKQADRMLTWALAASRLRRARTPRYGSRRARRCAV